MPYAVMPYGYVGVAMFDPRVSRDHRLLILVSASHEPPSVVRSRYETSGEVPGVVSHMRKEVVLAIKAHVIILPVCDRQASETLSPSCGVRDTKST